MTGVASDYATRLQGRRVLVVEDEYMIAEEIAEAVVAAGAEVLGPVSHVTGAWRLIAAGDRIDAALLDVNLGGEMVWPIIDELLARGVPLVLATGYDASEILPAYVHLPRQQKPTTGRDLTCALAQVLATTSPG